MNRQVPRRIDYLELRSKVLKWVRLGYIVVKKEVNIFLTKRGYQQFNDWKDTISLRNVIMIQLWVVRKIYDCDTMKTKRERYTKERRKTNTMLRYQFFYIRRKNIRKRVMKAVEMVIEIRKCAILYNVKLGQRKKIYDNAKCQFQRLNK